MNPDKVGNSEYDPRSMLKLLVYGYSYGVKSSRKLERECYHNLAFIWLMGGLRPDHKTIAEFRRSNKKALQKVLRQCARMCIKLDLIAGNILFVDGTKIRANAGRHRSHDRAYYEKLLADIDSRIEQLLVECETVDQSEEGTSSYVAMDKELSKAQNLKDRIKQALDAFESDDRKQVNQTDPDCAMMHSVQGSHASYNVQSVVDEEHGLIVHAEAVNATSDVNQFARQIERPMNYWMRPAKWLAPMPDMQTRMNWRRLTNRELRSLFHLSVKPCTKQKVHSARAILPMIKSRTLISARKARRCGTTIRISKKANDIIGLWIRSYALIVGIMVNAQNPDMAVTLSVCVMKR